MSRITKDEAIELNKNFIKTKGKALNKIVEIEEGHPNEKDAISSWFSLDEIKEYIAYVEAAAKEKKITVNGLRVYFGSYAVKDKHATKKGLSTVFIVPTKEKVSSLKKVSATSDVISSDIDDIDAMNAGTLGDPPSGRYPQ